MDFQSIVVELLLGSPLRTAFAAPLVEVFPIGFADPAVIAPCWPYALTYRVNVSGLDGYDIFFGLHGYNLPRDFSFAPQQISRSIQNKSSILTIDFPCTASNTFYKEHKLHVRVTYGNNKMVGSRDFEIYIASFEVDGGSQEMHLRRNSTNNVIDVKVDPFPVGYPAIPGATRLGYEMRGTYKDLCTGNEWVSGTHFVPSDILPQTKGNAKFYFPAYLNPGRHCIRFSADHEEARYDKTESPWRLLKVSDLPEVIGSHVDGVAPISATLFGNVNPMFAETNIHFEWGTTSGYGNATADHVIGEGQINDVSVSKILNGLSPNTEYHFRVIATNRWGTVRGPDQTFRTSPVSNHSPYIPGSPTPPDGDTISTVQPTLSWSGGDPDPTDTVTYDVFLSTTNPPSVVAFDIVGSAYQTVQLDYDTTYYWNVLAKDGTFSAESPVWNFTTPIAAVNLALGKPTQMSSYNFGTTGAEAVDGNTSGDWSEGSVTHTHPDNPSWWQVDLEHIAWVERVRLFNRTDCCQERLRDFDLMLSEDNVTWRSIYVPGPVADVLEIEVGAMARYVRVQLRQVDYLSLAEVVVQGEPATEHGLVLSLPMDEGGDVVVDESGNGYDGIPDGPMFVDDSGVLDSGAFAFEWSAADRVFVPYDSAQALTEAITVEAWVYPTAWDNIYFGYNRILSKQPVYLLRGANGHPHFQVLTENHGYQEVYGEALPLNEWHYLVGTFDGSRLALYVDGDLASTLDLVDPDRLVTNEADICVGESPALNEGFTGLIDEVAIYDRARTEAEIRETYKPMRDVGTNLALGKPTQMSSYNFGTTGAEAVDGNTSADSADGSVTHTHPDDPSWWEVDLAVLSRVNEVRIHNRKDCCSERLSNFDVMLSKDGETWESVHVPGQGGSPSIVELGGVSARYVRIQLRDVNYLSLAEVEVMGTPMGNNLGWTALGGGVWGADLVSDGVTLYRVGGDGQCHAIYQYEGPESNNWTLVTDANPQCYSHRSPGENNRSWYHQGAIVVAGHSHVGHPGGNTVTLYDLASDTWTVHDLPVFEHFSWGQGGALNADTGEVYISWTEEGVSHDFATAALDIPSGVWGPSYDRTSRIGRGVVALEDTSGRYVFDLVRGDRYVSLGIYDLWTEPGDFSGSWLASSTFDMGLEDFFMYGDRNYGSYAMAWDEVGQNLYLVATEKGTTLVYDPFFDRWESLESRPIGHGYRDGHVAIAHDRLYSQDGADLWYLPLR
jgi:hypothetical protein